VSRAASLVQVVARALADDPDAVSVVENEHRGTLLVELFMAPGDLGHVIGRQGRTAAAIRTLAAVAAESEGQQVQVELRDAPGPPPRPP
jgi:predicted RNA-binding protein YlqC (UPF0109 family)